MRYEVVELHCDCTLEVLLSTSSYEYAFRYFRFLKFLYGDYRDFYLRDKLKGLKYENN